jgi:hypothetical protein
MSVGHPFGTHPGRLSGFLRGVVSSESVRRSAGERADRPAASKSAIARSFEANEESEAIAMSTLRERRSTAESGLSKVFLEASRWRARQVQEPGKSQLL